MNRIKKLNNKGMTVVEVLVCFVLVVIISVSLYTMVSTYQNKQHIESCKEKIFTYKNLITKEIYDDLIKDELVSANIKELTKDPATGDVTGSVKMFFRNGESRCLNIKSTKAYDYDWDEDLNGSVLPKSADKDDDFMIAYGLCGNETIYPIPNVGVGENPNGKDIYDLRINTVDVSIEDSVLSIYIGFYHPELGTRYGIDIVNPINF